MKVPSDVYKKSDIKYLRKCCILVFISLITCLIFGSCDNRPDCTRCDGRGWSCLKAFKTDASFQGGWTHPREFVCSNDEGYPTAPNCDCENKVVIITFLALIYEKYQKSILFLTCFLIKTKR